MERGQVILLLRTYANIDREIEFRRGMLPDEEAEQDVGFLMELKKEISRGLCSLPYIQRDSIYRKYVKREKWERIRRSHNYSERNIRVIANKALAALGVALEDKAIVQDFLSR